MKKVNDTILSIEETAAALGLAENTIRCYVGRGTLSHVCGVPLSDIDRYMRERRPAGSKPYPDLEKIRAALQKTDVKNLPTREQSILRRRASGESLVSIGESLGLSRQRVQQLEKRAIEMMTETRTTG